MSPKGAVEWYLEHRKDDARTATIRTQESALDMFLEWAAEADLDDMTELSGRDLMRFKTWYKNHTDVTRVSLNGNLGILRRFLEFCEVIEAVESGLNERVPLPNVPPDEEINDFVPPNNQVTKARAYLRQFEYASRPHVEFESMAEIGLRMGSLRAIDLSDLQLSAHQIQLQHRPEGPETTGTPLKNGTDGERLLNISGTLVDVLADYIEHHRNDEKDQYAREPLLTTSAGRVTTTTIRRDLYKVSRPCWFGMDCPHDRAESACEATQENTSSKCPSSYSPHPLRKASIMSQLDEGVPKEILSARVDVSVPVLEQHYDQRSEERKSRRRREVLEDRLSEFEGE